MKSGVRQRPLSGAPHEAIGIALPELIECGCTGGNECGSDDRVGELYPRQVINSAEELSEHGR